MREQTQFTELMTRVRHGDQDAAARIVKIFEPRIHQAIGKPLRYSSLGRELDPHDISQIVLAKFFVNNLAARCDLVHPDQLTRLLVRMARNKLRDELRKIRAQRRSRRRLNPSESEAVLKAQVTRDGNPNKIVASRELLQVIYLRLDEDEKHLARQRHIGMNWSAIARNEGKSVEAVRKKLARALERIRSELEL